MDDDIILVDEPRPQVRRVTLNRPQKRNALSGALRAALLEALRAGDADPDVRVQIVRGAGSCFSAGYDLGSEAWSPGQADYTSPGDGSFSRQVTDGWLSIWDLAKPVIAQVHGYCLAGGSELATGCDLVYVADDAQIGYPAVRMGVPDMHFHAWMCGMRAAMEMMLTGDSISGTVAADLGWANRAFPVDTLEDEVLSVAARIAMMPPDLAQLNKRVVHRGMEVMGLRTAIRTGTELCALATHSQTTRKFSRSLREGVTSALQQRDERFGDYRTAPSKDDS